MSYIEDDKESLKIFQASLTARVKAYGLDHKDRAAMIANQAHQVNLLRKLEGEWKLALIKSPWCQQAYEAFIHEIADVRDNLLDSRPFLREKQVFFKDNITPAFKSRAWRSLLRLSINYNFIRLISDTLPEVKNDPELARLEKEIWQVRNDLIVLNLPLVLSETRKFWAKTPKKRISFMTLFQVGVLGLISCVDKYYDLEYSPSWREVAIQRSLGNFIHEYSGTHLHFYPDDAKKIYRTQKLITKFGIEGVVESLNNDPKVLVKTSKEEIKLLLNAVGSMSADLETTPTGFDLNDANKGLTTVISHLEIEPELHPDKAYEIQESRWIVRNVYDSLSIWEKKILSLAGLDIPAQNV